jgi:transcriptional regulator with GAF, ATPase, and Fis domain
VVASVTDAVQDLEITGSTGQATVGGVADWHFDAPSEFLARADRALMFAKQDKLRTPWSRWSEVPEDFHAASVSHARFDEDAMFHSALGEMSGDRVRRRSQQLMVVAALANRLAGLRDVDGILRSAASEVYHGLGYYQCCVDRLHQDGSVERVAASGAAFEDRPLVTMRVAQSSGVIGRTIAQRSTQLVDDVLADPDFVPDPDGELTRSELCVPILVGETVWGVLNIEERRRHAFDEHDVHVAEAVAANLGAALRLAT